MARTRPLSRRTLLRGAGTAMALPFLEAMLPPLITAQASPKRFFAFFYPNGADRAQWNPAVGPLTAATLTPCLEGLAGFPQEGLFPAQGEVHSHVTVVRGVDHTGVCEAIHAPAMALTAHRRSGGLHVPGSRTLDQVLADHVSPGSPFRLLALSACQNNGDDQQHYLSFRDDRQAEDVERDPRRLFDRIFSSVPQTSIPQTNPNERTLSVLDAVADDAQRLQGRLGASDRQRLEQYFQSVRELEDRLNLLPGRTCARPVEPAGTDLSREWHTRAKQFVDLALMALQCDLTRVVSLHYSTSWHVTYSGFNVGSGRESAGNFTDHEISHQLYPDGVTDLGGVPDAARIANARYLHASRFKVRRFAYLVDQLRTSGLLDSTLALFCTESTDGDSHSRYDMPTLLAGNLGGFQTGRVVDLGGATTGAFHASIARRFGLDLGSYGNPSGSAVSNL